MSLLCLRSHEIDSVVWHLRSWIFGLTFCCLSAAPCQKGEKPTPQPISFNHKLHATAGLKCSFCHPIEEPGFAAGLPSDSDCMVCHSTIKADSPDILKIARAIESGKTISWKRLYQIPDYVWFSHATHAVDAKIACKVCHGPVASREILSAEKPTSMDFCMDCHAARKASNGCDVCHSRQ